MSDRKQQSWLERLLGSLFGRPASKSGSLTPIRPVDVSIVPAQITELPAAGPRTVEDWRQLVGSGQRVAMSWDGGPGRGAVMAQGQVRTIFDETIWVWLDRELDEADRPRSDQAIQLLAPRDDAMRLVPGR